MWFGVLILDGLCISLLSFHLVDWQEQAQIESRAMLLSITDRRWVGKLAYLTSALSSDSKWLCEKLLPRTMVFSVLN